MATYYQNPNRAFQETVRPDAMISSAMLTPRPALNFQSPQPAPIFPVASLKFDIPQSAPAQIERQADNEIQQLRNLNTELAGKSSFEADQYRQQGYAVNRDAQGNLTVGDPALEDLNSQLTTLQAQAQAIPQQLQQQYEGRAATAAGVNPIQAGELRKNAIASLGVGALIAARQGKLSTAKMLVDNAVNEKYGPRQDEIAAKKANLELILQSPEYSAAQKQRANEQLLLQKTAEAQLNTQQDNFKTIQGTALQAAQNGAPAAVVNAVMNAQDLGSALSAAAGYLQKETATSIQEYQFAVRNGYEGSFTNYQNEDANRKVAIARAGVANGEFGLSNTQAALFNNIVNKYNASPLVAAADRASILRNSIAQARANPSDGATQLNLVYSYIQALDTYQSAVREGELALVSSIDSKVGQLKNSVDRIQNGQIVRPEVAKQIADAAEQLISTISNAAQSKEKSFASQASTLGLGGPWQSYIGGFKTSYAPSESAPFDDIKASLRIDAAKKTAYIPRSVWSTLGARQDALLEEAKKDGYKLLVE